MEFFFPSEPPSARRAIVSSPQPRRLHPRDTGCPGAEPGSHRGPPFAHILQPHSALLPLALLSRPGTLLPAAFAWLVLSWRGGTGGCQLPCTSGVPQHGSLGTAPGKELGPNLNLLNKEKICEDLKKNWGGGAWISKKLEQLSICV